MILEPPVARYLKGRLPSHSSTVKLFDRFSSPGSEIIKTVLFQKHYLNSKNQATRKALTDELLDRCGKFVFWNLDKVAEVLTESGFDPVRRETELEDDESDDGTPRWVNLGTLATYFSVSAREIGLWLDDLGYRDDEGLANEHAQELSLGTVTEMSAGGKKTRKISMWNLVPVRKALVDAGHVLDFDFERTMKGIGRNSDVKTVTVEDRAQEFATQFVENFKNPATRYRCETLVKSAPTAVVKRAESIMKKEGFITKGEYLLYIRKV